MYVSIIKQLTLFLKLLSPGKRLQDLFLFQMSQRATQIYVACKMLPTTYRLGGPALSQNTCLCDGGCIYRRPVSTEKVMMLRD